MASRLTDRSGCWTCRLRRKKCDGHQPACRNCTALEITCHNSEGKPEWMDGASKQREMSETIKARIREGTSARRERQSGAGPSMFIVTSQQGYASAVSESRNPMSRDSRLSGDEPAVPAPLPGPPLSSPGAASHEGENVPFENSSLASGATNSFDQQRELDYLMVYLDYVFPFLFPFYRPPLVGTGRGWLLSFVRENKAVYHSMLSMSSFFFTVGLKDIFGDRQPCQSVAWTQVMKQADAAFDMIRQDLEKVGRLEMPAGPLEKARIMEAIVQTLLFELFVGRRAGWEAHLTPAVALFKEILRECISEVLPGRSGLGCVLAKMAQSPPFLDLPGQRRPIWNHDQATFRFFTAVLVLVDIVGSTSLGRAPELREWYPALVTDLAPEEKAESIDLSAFFGCRNWAVLAIGDIAALEGWRAEREAAGDSSPAKLAERVNIISAQLHQGLAGLQDAAVASTAPSKNPGRLHPYYQHGHGSSANGSLLRTTRIWALAARIYLSVVASGWVSSDHQVRADVAEILDLLRAVERPGDMRAYAWPICVAGCLAEGEDEEATFAAIVDGVGNPQIFGALVESGRIMRAVWSRRDGLESDNRRLASYLRVLGSPALLF